MVGVFPPPVHGMATINAAVFERLREQGVEPLKLDLAAATLDRGWANRLGRVTKVARAFIAYASELARGGGQTMYIGLSGGWGQMYESLFVVIARLRGARIFLHHHSFAYLDESFIPASVLIHLAGKSATHVVLCEIQERRLRDRYPIASRVRNLSNAAVMKQEPATLRFRTSLRRVGFLGNISREKGIADVIAIAERLHAVNPSMHVEVAGPFENATVERDFRDAANRVPLLKYTGPVYGFEKDAFLDSVDVMLFPSSYINETAPLVVYEAMSRGIPVIAKRRGCLADMIPNGAGICVCPEEDYAARALDCLLQWQRDPANFGEMSKAAVSAFQEQMHRSTDDLDDLLRELSADSNPELSGSPCR